MCSTGFINVDQMNEAMNKVTESDIKSLRTIDSWIALVPCSHSLETG